MDLVLEDKDRVCALHHLRSCTYALDDRGVNKSTEYRVQNTDSYNR